MDSASVVEQEGNLHMQILTYIIAVIVIVALCLLAMSVGLIFRGKTFTSCGCASITFRGEKIRCASCPDKDEDSGDKPSA
jgi:hypothetical protein